MCLVSTMSEREKAVEREAKGESKVGTIFVYESCAHRELETICVKFCKGRPSNEKDPGK